MELTTIATLLEQRGIVLTLSAEGKLQSSAPAGAIPPELAQIIRENRAALLAKLKEEQASAPAPEREQAPAPAPETERQADNLRPWRPTPTELARWDSYYQGAAWYAGKNLFRDNPAGLALEYATGNNSGACCALFSVSLLAFYGDCQALALTTESGQQELDPCQFTELLHQAYQECRAAALLALAFNFIESATRRGELQEVLTGRGFTLPTGQVSAPASTLTSIRQDMTSTCQVAATSAPAPGQKRQRRAIVYADIKTGRAVNEQATRIDFAPGATLSELVSAITAVTECGRLFLCGEPPASFEMWLLDPGMHALYTTGKRGHYFDTEKATNHVGRYQHRATGQELEIRTLHSWYGDAPYTPEEAQGAMQLLSQYLQREFMPETRAYATPALTYQSLWQLLNRLNKRQFELLPEDIRALIHSTTGQGRIELCTPDALSKIPALWYYDGVFMYSALCWGMPTELAAHDNLNEYAGKVPARYRIRYTVPATWEHIGLFMTPKDKVTGNARDRAAWCYPGQDYQGRTFETWADGAELDVAYNLPAGLQPWDITILERIVFKPEKDSEKKKPLDVITERLSKMREKVERDMLTDATRQALYRLVRGAIRNILLHGIGSFHRSEREVTFVLRDDEPAPDGYSNMRLIGEHTIRYSIPQKIEKYTQQFEHPEWTGLVWARCRARITRAALSLPRQALIAIRTDAIATTEEQPQWAESDKRGTLREKWHITRSMKAPHSFEELDGLVHQYVKEDR